MTSPTVDEVWDEAVATLTSAIDTPKSKVWMNVMGDGGDVRIWVQLYPGECAQVWIEPGVANWEQHRERVAALMVAAKLAASLASHCDGKVYQEATVTECLGKLPQKSNLVADYPETPLQFGRLCPGLQAALTPQEKAE